MNHSFRIDPTKSLADVNAASLILPKLLIFNLSLIPYFLLVHNTDRNRV